MRLDCCDPLFGVFIILCLEVENFVVCRVQELDRENTWLFGRLLTCAAVNIKVKTAYKSFLRPVYEVLQDALLNFNESNFPAVPHDTTYFFVEVTSLRK